MSALKLTLVMSVAVAAVNAVAGTAIAWTLVRDRFPGQSVVNALVDHAFALPTIVAGLTLLALYGPKSPVGVNTAFHALGDPVRAPVRDAALRRPDGAAGAARARPRDGGRGRLARSPADRHVPAHHSPGLMPAILSGVALAFARAIGEFGAGRAHLGNLPFKTEVASVYVFGRIESGDPGGAAAASVVILAISFGILLAIGGLRRWVTRHDG